MTSPSVTTRQARLIANIRYTPAAPAAAAEVVG